LPGAPATRFAQDDSFAVVKLKNGIEWAPHAEPTVRVTISFFNSHIKQPQKHETIRLPFRTILEMSWGAVFCDAAPRCVVHFFFTRDSAVFCNWLSPLASHGIF
jgi:hypothetical protein